MVAAPARERLLDEVFDFRPGEGLIRLREQRVVILSAAAMGLLRKELIQTLGIETARRVLLRFGFADGYHDAINLKDQLGWSDPLDGVRAAATIHALEGIVRAEFLRLDHDPATGAFGCELAWQRSYEGEQHLEHYGRGSQPVCWSLVGYISGYVSASLGAEIYFRETRCVGLGHGECRLVGRHAGGWGEDLAGFRFDFQGADLGAEVERLRVAATRQRQALAARERALVRREREMDALQQRVSEHVARQRFVVRSPQMQSVLDLASRVAPLDTTVLVTGESGTGKEFIVRLVHAHSARAGGPLVSVNCAALTETLLESELFGHVRGAFTGAVRDKAGLFEVATDGTLFLDEIGEMAPTIQAKLLRALQEGEIRRVGSERDIKVRPRIITATNRDLRATVAEGRFREDLYFRLAGFVIAIPPLRERTDDIPALAQEFLRRTASRLAKDAKALSSQAMIALVSYPWPGNVRELEHAVERAVILSRGPVLSLDDLPPEVRGGAPRAAGRGDLDLESFRRAMLEEALRRFPRSRKAAAAALGVSTVTLWRMMVRYGLAGSERRGGRSGV
ncbi:MAG TPA: sigma-54-dependent Fis family transcriptional regulator [Vicinamibacterales bacterium]|nr:sigma-54-dependent Fis family transcriptional regulator [Vicinamibacterales bacterium]HPW19484.1 sigma-54-dependent Fis family transcriptional regulator [Vicinamibacterales bacterium]